MIVQVPMQPGPFIPFILSSGIATRIGALVKEEKDHHENLPTIAGYDQDN